MSPIISREEAATGNNAVIIFALCAILVYLILAALYESLLLPLVVIISIPCGLMGSFLFAKIFGLENNIYLQTGLIMLIGLLAKTAILITEYAGERRKGGLTLYLEVLTAQQALLGAQQSEVQCRYDEIAGIISLYHALGGGK